MEHPDILDTMSYDRGVNYIKGRPRGGRDHADDGDRFARYGEIHIVPKNLECFRLESRRVLYDACDS